MCVYVCSMCKCATANVYSMYMYVFVHMSMYPSPCGCGGGCGWFGGGGVGGWAGNPSFHMGGYCEHETFVMYLSILHYISLYFRSCVSNLPLGWEWHWNRSHNTFVLNSGCLHFQALCNTAGGVTTPSFNLLSMSLGCLGILDNLRE